ILEHVPVHTSVAHDWKECGPLVDRHAGIVGLDDAHATDASAIELDDVGHAGDAVADQPGEDPPLAFSPLSEVAFARIEEALGVAPSLPGRDRFPEHFDVLAGHHLEATATEYALDLLGSHCITMRVVISATTSAAKANAPTA